MWVPVIPMTNEGLIGLGEHRKLKDNLYLSVSSTGLSVMLLDSE